MHLKEKKKNNLARKHILTVTFRGLLKVFLIKIDQSGDSVTKMCSEGSNYDLILCQNIFCCIALFPCAGENVISGWLLKVLTCSYILNEIFQHQPKTVLNFIIQVNTLTFTLKKHTLKAFKGFYFILNQTMKINHKKNAIIFFCRVPFTDLAA